MNLQFHSMKSQRVDSKKLSSSVPVLAEMGEANLKSFAAYEQKRPLQLVINVQQGEMNERPIAAICVTAVCPLDGDPLLDITESLRSVLAKLEK